METCSCDATLKNTGTPACKSLMSYAEMLILVPKYGSTGALNFIDLTDTLDQAYFTAKINASDPRDRWYPTPRVKDADSTKAASEFKTFNDASKIKIRDGVRSWSLILTQQTPQFLGQLEAWGCAEFGIYIVDKSENLIGSLKAEGELYPITVDEDTWNPVFAFAKGNDIQMINLSFDIDLIEQDSDLNFISAAELSPVRVINLEGLVDVVSVISSISQTDFSAELKVKGYGSALSPIHVEGLLITDFISSVGGATGKIRNQTTGLDVTITSVVESPAGTYDINFASQTVGNVLILKPKKNKFDFSLVEKSTITVV